VPCITTRGAVGFPSYHAVESVLACWYLREARWAFVAFLLFNVVAFHFHAGAGRPSPGRSVRRHRRLRPFPSRSALDRFAVPPHAARLRLILRRFASAELIREIEHVEAAFGGPCVASSRRYARQMTRAGAGRTAENARQVHGGQCVATCGISVVETVVVLSVRDDEHDDRGSGGDRKAAGKRSATPLWAAPALSV